MIMITSLYVVTDISPTRLRNKRTKGPEGDCETNSSLSLLFKLKFYFFMGLFKFIKRDLLGNHSFPNYMRGNFFVLVNE